MSGQPQAFRFAVNVTPKPGILDPQGRAVEGRLDDLGIAGVSAVRVGRRVELTAKADDAAWRLLFNALSPSEVERQVQIRGDRSLAASFVRARSVIV